MNSGQALYNHAKERIPGGTQLLSKRPEMFLPDHWPAYYKRAKGCSVFDLDDHHYYDFTHCGVGTCILGYADPVVDEAVTCAIEQGTMCSLNCPEEVELADLLCGLHPWADMVRYARTGGEAMAVAVRIARTKTKQDKIALASYSGWHDWYLATNLVSDKDLEEFLPGLSPKGVPQCLRGTTHAFLFNNIDRLKWLANNIGNQLAAIVIEPIRNHWPMPGFLERVREIANEIGAVLIFDEITSGFRLTCGGAHKLFGVEPDIAVFAKAMSNGYPMAAIIGRGDVMQAAQDTFISSTYWTERIGPTAALATIRRLGADIGWRGIPEAFENIKNVGERVQAFWAGAAQRTGLNIEVSGIPQLSHFSIKYDKPRAAMTLFTQLMLDRGFLASGSFYPTLAHTPERPECNFHSRGDRAVAVYFDAVHEVFCLIANAIEHDTVEEQLKGPVAHEGFKRLN